MMAKASKRVRSAKWNDSETMLLAELERETFLRGEEGGHVWQDISQTISGRSAIQCQRRWETLVKVYNDIKEYCTQTGQEHEELDDAELASMKLETAYRREWFMIVQEVCSERKRRRIFDGGAAALVSKGSSTPVMETLQATTHPATTDSPDPLEDARETEDVTVKVFEIEYAESQPAHSGLLDECPSDAQCNGPETEEGGTFDSITGPSNFEEKPPSPIPENRDLSWCCETIARKSPSIISEGTIIRQSSYDSIMEALHTNLTLQATSKVITSPVSDCEDITIFQSRETLDIENHDGQVAISTVRWAPNSPRWPPNSPRRDTMASSLSGWVDAPDELNLQFEQTRPGLEFLVPESSWPESSRHDRGLLENFEFASNSILSFRLWILAPNERNQNGTFDCFSPPLSISLHYFPEDRIQEQIREQVREQIKQIKGKEAVEDEEDRFAMPKSGFSTTCLSTKS